MLLRADVSLRAVGSQWNRMRWKFLQSEQIIGLVAPFTVTGCTTTAGSTTVTTTVSNGFLSVLADDIVNGGGIRPDTVIGSVATGAATALDLVAAASATVTGAALIFKRPSYALASDFKSIFDVRLLGSPKPLYYQPRRLYDREVIDQSSPIVPYGYDLYLVGGKGKIRILPPPGAAETIALKYYRRIDMYNVLDGLLDVPQDYEDVFIAAAKAHFLADKGQAHREQWLFWEKYAANGLKEMRKDERLVEDEDLSFQPPIPQRVYGPNSPFYRPDWGF